MHEISFQRAPVVELIAELRWNPSGVVGTGAPQLMLGAGQEEFFQHFGSEVNKYGYTQAEKVVPAGVPPILHQVTWRYRRPGDGRTLLQVGPGLFSANALQPYRRWQDFRPTVELGVNALLATRLESEKSTSFTNLSLRYMNAFTGELLAGRTPAGFIKDVLGVKLLLPDPISELVDPNLQVSSNANLLIPIANTSKVMSLVVGDGALNAEPAAIFDVTVGDKNISSSAGDVLAALDASRDVIHECFLRLTEPVAELMKPVGGNHAS